MREICEVCKKNEVTIKHVYKLCQDCRRKRVQFISTLYRIKSGDVKKNYIYNLKTIKRKIKKFQVESLKIAKYFLEM